MPEICDLVIRLYETDISSKLTAKLTTNKDKMNKFEEFKNTNKLGKEILESKI